MLINIYYIKNQVVNTRLLITLDFRRLKRFADTQTVSTFTTS